MTKDKRENIIQDEDEIFDQYYDMNSVASATSYTGLTPTPPHSVDEAESYSKIYSYPNQDNISKKSNNSKDQNKKDKT